MAQTVSRKGKITKGTFTVAEMAEWTIDAVADAVGEGAFQDTYDRKAGIDLIRWTISFNGHHDSTDTTGQVDVDDDFKAGTLVTDMKFYYNNTSYYYADTSNDSDSGIYITGFSVAVVSGSTNRVTCTATGTGQYNNT